MRENPLATMRPDGGALAVAVGRGIALWETNGTVRWLVRPDAAFASGNPVWSPDGAFVYFGRWKMSSAGDLGEDLGIFRVRSDGSDLGNVVPGQPTGQSPPVVSVPRMVTKENRQETHLRRRRWRRHRMA